MSAAPAACRKYHYVTAPSWARSIVATGPHSTSSAAFDDIGIGSELVADHLDDHMATWLVREVPETAEPIPDRRVDLDAPIGFTPLRRPEETH